MDDVAFLLTERACERLVYRYARHPSRGWLFARRDISTPLARDIASVSEGR